MYGIIPIDYYEALFEHLKNEIDQKWSHFRKKNTQCHKLMKTMEKLIAWLVPYKVYTLLSA